MGFKPQGMPTAFARSGSANQQQRKRVIDLLVTVESYDFGQQQLNCVGDDGTKMLVQIRPETVARNIKRSKEIEAQGARPLSQKWEGYMIDQRMADNLPQGHRVVIEKAERMRSVTHNGATAYLMMSDRIINLSDQSLQKVFEGLFSISTYQNNIFHVQHWEEKAISVDDTANIDRIAAQLDDDCNAFLNKELRPHHGVQFRVVQPALNPDDKGIVLDISPCFDWISKQVDANGNEVTPGRPLDAQKFKALLLDPQEGYIPAYVQQAFPAEQYPGCFVEVCYYTNYRAGPRSRYMVIPDRVFDPIYRLAFTQTKLAIDDTEFVMGKNVAVRGVLQLSADQADLQTRTFKARNIAVRLHASGIIGHVHAWVRDHLGRKTTPHESLKQVNVNRSTPGEKTALPSEQSNVPSSAPTAPAASSYVPATPTVAASAPAATPGVGMDNQNAFDEWEDFDEDPFAAELGADARSKLDQARKNLGDE